MPNTLAHLGVQGLATRALIRGADPKWIFLGAVVPDVPWILQRGIRTVAPSVDAYDLRLYAIVQASLFISLLLCGALAAASSAPRRVFGILSLNAVLHLLLDASQTKWGNGVHLFAPLSWRDLNFGWFWPESPTTAALTALGLGYVSWCLVALRARSTGAAPGGRHPVLAAALLGAYLLLPLPLRSTPLAADSHSVATLRGPGPRAGQPVEFDRVLYTPRPDGGTLWTLAGEALAARGVEMSDTAKVSVRGRFAAADTVVVAALHVHRGWPRELMTYIGLLLVAGWWGRDVLRGPGQPCRSARRITGEPSSRVRRVSRPGTSRARATPADPRAR